MAAPVPERLPHGGLLVGQRVKVTRDLYDSDVLFARRGARVTVAGHVDRLQPRRGCAPRSVRIQLVSGAGMDVLFSDVDPCLPGGWKTNDWVVFRKPQQFGPRVAQEGDSAMVVGMSRTRPRKTVCVRFKEQMAEVALADLAPFDKGKHPSLGSQVTINCENTDDDFDERRAGTNGLKGVVLKAGTGRGDRHTVRLDDGRVLSYSTFWVTWERIVRNYALVARNTPPKPTTIFDRLRATQKSLLSTSEKLQKACHATFGDQLPPQFAIVRDAMDEVGTSLEEVRKAAHATTTRQGALKSRKRRSMETADEPAPKKLPNGERRGVSEFKRECGKRNFGKIALWLAAKKQAKAALGISGFCGFKRGSREHQKARDIYAAMQRR
jgi:hypothetical protein